MRLPRFLITCVLGPAILLGSAAIGETQEESDAKDEVIADAEGGKWAWRSHIGTQFRTIDDTDALLFAFSGDYRLRPKLTVGPYAFVSSSENLVEYAWTLVARLHMEMGFLKVSPFVGAGILSADFDMDSEFGFSSESSGFAAPFGLTLQLDIKEATFFITGMGIVHSLEFDVPPVGSGPTRTDPKSAAVMIGVGM